MDSKTLEINFVEGDEDLNMDVKLLKGDSILKKLTVEGLATEGQGYEEILRWLGYNVEEVWTFEGQD